MPATKPFHKIRGRASVFQKPENDTTPGQMQAHLLAGPSREQLLAMMTEAEREIWRRMAFEERKSA